MTRKKLHIDELFRNGLKNLSFFVSNKDMEAIDDKKSQFENSPDEIKNTSFSGFELEVTENDWISTKNKLDIEKASMAQDTVFSKSFDDFELEVFPEDWTETYRRYLNRKKRRSIFIWMGTGIVLLLVGLSVLLMNTFNSENKENALVINSTNTIENSEESNLSTEQNNSTEENTPLNEGNENTTTNENSSINENSSGQNNNTPNSQNNSANNITNPTAQKQSSKTNEGGNNKTLEGNSENSKNNGIDQSNESTKFVENTDVKKTFDVSIADNSNKDVTSNETSDNGSTANEKPNTTLDKPTEKIENPVGLIDSNKNIDNQKVNSIDTPDTKNKTDVTIPPTPAKIGLYVGLINRIASTHRVLGNQNDSRYNSIRNSGEKPIFEWSKGIDIGIQKSGFLFNTGAQFSTQTWVTNYVYNYKVYDSIPVIRNGQIIGYFPVNARDTFINEMNEVKIEKINIPIEINRIIKLNKNTNLIAGAGMMFGWNTKISGTKLLNPLNLQLYHYNRLKENERTFNMSPSLTLGIQNTIYKNFKIQTAFYGNMSMYSRFIDGFSVQDNPYTLGINIKLLYQIK